MRVVVDGVEVELYTIGYTAKLLKKSVETVRAWERAKIIPKPMYKTGKVRLYHPKEVEAMKKALRKSGKGARRDELQKQMYAELRIARQEILHGPKQDNTNGT